MITMEKESEGISIKIQKWLVKENESPGRIRRNKYALGDLDAKEQRDNKFIKKYLTYAPG